MRPPGYRLPAQHPGVYIRRELRARGWSQADLALILGRPPRLISELVNGKRSITLRTAIELGEAFTSPTAFNWMVMQNGYDVSRALPKSPTEIDKRLAAFERRRKKEVRGG